MLRLKPDLTATVKECQQYVISPLHFLLAGILCYTL